MNSANSKQFTIKNASIDDVPLILDLIKEIAIYEKLQHEAKATKENIEKYLFSDKAVAECLIAYVNEVPIGFALFFHNFSTFVGKSGIYLEDLFIKEAYRGEGYGKKLLLHLVNIAKQRNCGRVEWSVLDWNKPAIDFYNKLGAKAMDEWTTFRLDAEAIDNLVK